MNPQNGEVAPSCGAPVIAVVVCTRNRAAKLALTLQLLKSLNVPAGYRCEIVVVDNGSTDETSAVCAKFATSPGLPLKREYLAIPGTGRAKNAGIRASSGSIVAFTDDDIRPEANWLEIIAQEFAMDPLLGVISGRVELQNPADLPLSIRRGKTRKEFEEIGDAFSTFIGCNFAVRRSVFDRVGLFDPEFGPGGRFVAAEDAEFFYRAWAKGEKLVYVPEILVFHDHGRRTSEAQLKLASAYLSGRGAFYAKYVFQRDPVVTRSAYWEMSSALRNFLTGDRNLGWRHPAWLLQGFLRYMAFRVLALSGRKASLET